MSGFSNLRTDRGPLSPPITATIYEGRVARTHAPGDALMYVSGPEHRDTNELSNIVSQLAGLPIYVGHPSVFPAAQSGQKPVGTVESGRLDEDTAVARLAVTDSEALKLIEAGTHELSLGYACQLDGDRFQRNIKLDHLAIVDRARCGPTCSMRTDVIMEEVMTEDAATVKCPTCGEMYPKGSQHTCNMDAELNAKKRNALESGEFAVPESRKLPIHDESHVRAAMSRFGQTEFASSAEKRAAFHKIVAKAHSFGIETSGFEKAWEGRLDSVEQACTCNIRAINHNSGETMSDTNKDTELQGKLDAALAELAALKQKVTTLEVEATNARKDADATKAKLDAAEAAAAQVKTDAEEAVSKAKADAAEAIKNEIDARVKSRVELLVEAQKFEIKDAEGNALKLDALSDREIKCAVIKHVDGDEVPADKSIDYVDGVYRGSLKRASGSGSREVVRTAINEMRKDAAAAGGQAPRTGRAAEVAAKEAMKRNSASAWIKTSNE